MKKLIIIFTIALIFNSSAQKKNFYVDFYSYKFKEEFYYTSFHVKKPMFFIAKSYPIKCNCNKLHISFSYTGLLNPKQLNK